MNKFRLFLCRTLNIHLAPRKTAVKTIIKAVCNSKMQATKYEYQATYCSLCHKQLKAEQISQELFTSWPIDTSFQGDGMSKYYFEKEAEAKAESDRAIVYGFNSAAIVFLAIFLVGYYLA